MRDTSVCPMGDLKTEACKVTYYMTRQCTMAAAPERMRESWEMGMRSDTVGATRHD